MKFESKYKTFYLQKCIWTYRLRNGVQGRWVKQLMVNSRAWHCAVWTSFGRKLYARGDTNVCWPLCFVNYHLFLWASFKSSWKILLLLQHRRVLLGRNIGNKTRAENFCIAPHFHEYIHISPELLQENSMPLASWQWMYHTDVQTPSSTCHPNETDMLVKNRIIAALSPEHHGVSDHRQLVFVQLFVRRTSQIHERSGARLNLKVSSYWYTHPGVKDCLATVLSLKCESMYPRKTVFILRRGQGDRWSPLTKDL